MPILFRIFQVPKWVCLKIGYIPNYSHLIGIMISKTIGFRGTLFSDTPKCQNVLFSPSVFMVASLIELCSQMVESWLSHLGVDACNITKMALR